MSKTISASIPDNLAARLEIFVKETNKSESFHIEKALESYLEDYADLNIAQERLRDVSDPVISLDDMRKKLGI
ncbi:MAG: DNA-binding protein [Desulfobacteraceae bacterium IS3]|nr:MAG: DNA-binding protein [Desulfobacteraceae bacterium IS3]